ncbi:hypothetical protein L6R52_34950, partial [Myxococcota bacterium]|nr:hypothetical protein [Myxococcota bacterium]
MREDVPPTAPDRRDDPAPSAFARAQFKDPISNAAHAWLSSLGKALKGMRVYESNNQMLQRFVEKTLQELAALQALAEEITFSVREDRLLYASTVGGVAKLESIEVAEDKLPASEVAPQIAKKLAPVRQAYEAVLEKQQGVAGQLTVSFTIAEGRARHVEIVEDELEQPTVREAVLNTAGSWLWPGRDGALVTARLSMKPVRREDPVLVDPDRQEGIPFAFYRNGFRRLTFTRGFGVEQLTPFLKALATDFGAVDNVGEDLVSVLWRLDLPYFRYLTIDGLTIGAASNKEQEHEAAEIDRLQADIDNLLAQIYSAHSKEVGADDLVKNASITRDDLHALEGIRDEDPEDLDQLDVVTQRAIANLTKAELDPVLKEVAEDDRDLVLFHVVQAMVGVLYSVRSSEEIGPKLGLLQQLFDTLIVRSGFRHATMLLEQIRAGADDTEDLKRRHISRHIQRMLATESRVAEVVLAFNDPLVASNTADVLAFLRCLGPSVTKHALRSLDGVTSPTHRRMILDLVAELEMPSFETLRSAIESAKWFVVCDLLALVPRFTLTEQAQLLAKTAEHENPKVRAITIGMLRTFPEGGADELVARAIDDAEAEVRVAAGRVAAARLSRRAGHAIGEWLRGDGLSKSDAREMNAMMLAFAQIGGNESVSVLDQLLNPGLFAGKTDVQVAAAIALASVGTADAKRSIQRGMRTLNAKVRDACKQALARFAEAAPGKRAHESTIVPGFDPFVGLQSMAIELRTGPTDSNPGLELDAAAMKAVEDLASAGMGPMRSTPIELTARAAPALPDSPPRATSPARSTPEPVKAAQPWAPPLERSSFIVRGQRSQDILPSVLPPMPAAPSDVAPKLDAAARSELSEARARSASEAPDVAVLFEDPLDLEVPPPPPSRAPHAPSPVGPAPGPAFGAPPPFPFGAPAPAFG